MSEEDLQQIKLQVSSLQCEHLLVPLSELPLAMIKTQQARLHLVQEPPQKELVLGHCVTAQKEYLSCQHAV